MKQFKSHLKSCLQTWVKPSISMTSDVVTDLKQKSRRIHGVSQKACQTSNALVSCIKSFLHFKL